ncbi:MAG TPA: thioesterase family protein [Candidatus Enterousia avicola]|uniref:Thioesterase family protein n=1 Tax=Candidatus Enterousia avicola TaxID=2840787 RepID=A0A9D1MRK6_9PROT|nr:thioesterase family protein [Candidatus Enterousia avicola]
MKIHKFPFAIAYADTDAGGIVYHGRYIEIAERARMDVLRGIKYPDGDVGFVVRDLNIRYIKPLFLADTVVVETAVTKLGAASLGVEQKFVKNGEICAILSATAAYIGADLQLKRIPESVAVPFREYL